MYFFFLPSFLAVLVIGFIQLRDQFGTPTVAEPEEAAVMVPIEAEA